MQNLISSNEGFLGSSTNEVLKSLDAKGQNPEAIIVSCSDSRVPPEVIFQKKSVGELFVIRTAGNVVDDVALASIEYACLVLKTPLCIVMGHSKCGAVGEALRCFNENDQAPTPALKTLVKHIMPAVEKTKTSDDHLAKAIAEHALATKAALMEKSQGIRESVESGSFKIVAAVCDMATGKVTEVS